MLSNLRPASALCFKGWAFVTLLVLFAPVQVFSEGRIAGNFHVPSAKPTSGLGLEDAFGALRFDQPVAIESAPGETNRLFIVERRGVISVITNLANPSKSIFLDLRESTWSGYKEAGLLAMSFHPGYATNGYFFVYRTVESLRLTDRLSRFEVSTLNPNLAAIGSETILISQYDESAHHNGGALGFGPDGYLYLGIGEATPFIDNASSYPVNIDKALFGVLIRIDVDNRPGNLPPNPGRGLFQNYSIPADNPWVGATSFSGRPVETERVRTELYAVGLRQPYRLAFDFETHELYVGDVGESRFEEINLVTKGGDYGYPYVEAEERFDLEPPSDMAFEAPLFFYGHGAASNQVGGAVIGGIVCKNCDIPELERAYIFGDFVSGNIWKLEREGTNTSSVWLAREMGISSFGRDPSSGSLLIANISDGSIRRLVKTEPENSEAPLLLSQTGLFSDLATLSPAPGLEPYEINVPFWSDHAIKRRWFALPNLTNTFGFAPEGNWKFPTGAVWVKHFDLELETGNPISARRLETRLLVKSDSEIFGYTYKWNAEQSEATLVPSSGENEWIEVDDHGVTKIQNWRYPGRGECNSCHSSGAGYILGFSTAQLNREVTRGGDSLNQLEWLAHNGYLDQSIEHESDFRRLGGATDASLPLEHRVQSFLAANCAGCHQPGATAIRMRWDARIETPIRDAGLLNAIPLIPHSEGARLIKPRDPENSSLLARLVNLGDPFLFHMPPLASNETNYAAINLLTEWINGIPDGSLLSGQLGGERLHRGSLHAPPGQLTISSANTGFNDSFFAGKLLTNNSYIVARIRRVDGDTSGRQAGLMFRTSTNQDGIAISLSQGVAGKNQLTLYNGEEQISDPASAAGTGFQWLRLIRDGNFVSAWESEAGTDWKFITNSAVDLPQSLLGALHVSSGSQSTYATVAFDEFRAMSIGLSVHDSDPQQTLPKPVKLIANVAAESSNVQRVVYYSMNRPIGEATEAPWSFTWTNAWAEEHLLTAAVYDRFGGSVTTAPVQLALTRPATSIQKIKPHQNVDGLWVNRIGQIAKAIPGLVYDPAIRFNEAVEEILPAGVGPGLEDLGDGFLQSRWTGDALNFGYSPPSENPYLLRLLFSADTGPIRVNLTFLDAVTGDTIASVPISNPTGANFHPFVIRGAVWIRITSTDNSPATLNGVFIDPVTPPTVEITASATEVQLPSTIRLQATATGGEQNIRGIRFYEGSRVIGEDLQPPYEFHWSNLLTGDHTVFARAIGQFGLNADSREIRISVAPPPAVAEFIRSDTTTGGDWPSSYGRGGFVIPALSTNLPSTILYESEGWLYVWDFLSENPSALRRIFEPEGILAVEYRSSFKVWVRLLDDHPQQIAFYFVDSPEIRRSQRIRLVDNQTDAVLDERILSEFADGLYLVYRLTGHIRIEFESTDVWEPVLGGMFVDQAVSAADWWRFQQLPLLSEPNSGWLDDFDGDGRVNLMEYAVQSDPRVADAPISTSYSVSDQMLIIEVGITQVSEDVSLKLQSSNDLVNWSDLNQPGDLGEESVRFRLPITEGASAFYRVHVELR